MVFCSPTIHLDAQDWTNAKIVSLRIVRPETQLPAAFLVRQMGLHSNAQIYCRVWSAAVTYEQRINQKLEMNDEPLTTTEAVTHLSTTQSCDIFYIGARASRIGLPSSQREALASEDLIASCEDPSAKRHPAKQKNLKIMECKGTRYVNYVFEQEPF